MNNYISVEVFIENDVSGDWGKEFPDEKHKTKVFCVRGADINDLNIGKIENLPVRYVKEASKDKFLEKGNIIIEISGGSPTQSTGRVAFLENIDREVVCSNFCRALKIKKEYSPKYVFYLLQNIYNSGVFFNFESKTSGIKNLLYNSAFENIKVPNQDYSSQQKIENVITVIDKKIQLLHQINDNLAELAKTIYDYWFVQFDFPDENGKPYKTSGGKMVYNEVLKREIPEGWEVKSLYEIADYINGLACQKYRPTNENNFLPVIKIKEMNEGISSNTEKVRTDIPEKYIIYDGDVLFSWSASLDVKIWVGGKGGLNQHIFKVKSDKFPMSFYFFELKNYLQHFKMMAELRKTTMGHITINHLKDSYISIPTIVLIEKLDIQLRGIIENIVSSKKQIQHLQSLRDWLLPMLMNGQISVE